LEGQSIKAFVESAAQQLSDNAMVLDSGAGQSPYRHIFDRQKYFSMDFGRGESAWDYSRLDCVGKLESLSFRSNTFDAVISTQVLEHVSEPEAVLFESNRVLKPGGTLFLTAPQGFGEHQLPYDFFRFTRYGLKYLLEKTGFDVVSIKPRGGYFVFMAVMFMWFYLYLFPDSRTKSMKILLFPLQFIAATIFLLIMPPFLSILDFLDQEKIITLGYAVIARKR
jgi:SAM-dependent methyltransferase